MWPDNSERDRFGNHAEDAPAATGVVPPEAEDYDLCYPDPLTCDRCGAVCDEWDNWCEECGAPVGEYARLKEAGMLEAFIHSRTPVTADTPF